VIDLIEGDIDLASTASSLAEKSSLAVTVHVELSDNNVGGVDGDVDSNT
jgi:hypothetical protein